MKQLILSQFNHHIINIGMAAAILICLSVASPLTAQELVHEFKGTSSTETAQFKVQAPWLIDWSVNGDYLQSLALQVSLIDAKTGRHEGYVINTKRVGDGVKLFKTSGTYRLRIDATLARWTFKIEQLTAAEAALYTPKGGD